ncbi:serine/threonine-protein kinase M1 [Puccinia graminis f. sp. tritici]|uniref:non-specific serine/threonine protein kinase n=2 Tax=Puccinia graminis f. sp. tritici TaxID=56615 RepID=E3KP97_PUCGT|nr:uncharacterized protein PGTG_12078 [Puccinia graminis f. sp. tritici CRL 75-36-700-3]EFP86122.1 hypothetical protein PGTG_12078 [Puccinia graminis f. sp. tritici CRL 75-36-700-3]KAA1101223.1 serine/threonine-protein kinase M1 [Puccinia graminis f. sp. tritici]
MSFQTLNNAFGTNEAPASTARILESIIRPSSTLEGGHSTSSLGIEQATALIRVVFNTSLDQFFGIHRWQTKMALHKQKDLSDATKNVLQFTFGQEFCRTPVLLIRRFLLAKDHQDLIERAQGATSRTQAEGENTSPAVLEEELSIWLLIRMLYCAALIRDSPMEYLPEDFRADRIDFVHRLEASSVSIHYYLFCSTDREIRAVGTARAVDFAKFWTTINEEIRSRLMRWMEGSDHLGYIELLGTDRRTQIPLTQDPVDIFQLEQRPFRIPIISQPFAIHLLLSSLRIHFRIIHHSIYFLETIPSAVEALITLWEYTMKSFPDDHDQRVLEDLTDMLGWFFEEPTEPTQLVLVTTPKEVPNHLANYIKSRSPTSLDKICSAIVDQCSKLFAPSTSSDQSQLAGKPCSQNIIVLFLKILRWLADENGKMSMSQTSGSITRLVVKHGKSMIEDLLSNSEAALNIANPNLQMMSLALLCCPMDTRYGRAKYRHTSQGTYVNYELMDYTSIYRFESLLSMFTAKWIQQISAQKYCTELGRFLHWLVQSLQAIHLRLNTTRTSSRRKRKRGDPEELDHAGPFSFNDDNETSATTNVLPSRSQHQLPNNSTSSPTTLHCNLISLLTSCSALAELPADLGKGSLTPIILKSLERITSLISHRPEDYEAQIKMFQTLERGFDLLGALICNSALEQPGFLNATNSDDLAYLPTDDLRNLFQCPSCDRSHLDPTKPKSSESQFLPRCIFTSAIMLCYNSDLLSYLSQKIDKLTKKEKSIQLAKSGARLAFIRFLTRVLNHTVIGDLSSIKESPIVCTSEVNMRIASVLERGNRMERIAAGRMLAGVFSNSLHLLSIWPAGQLSDFQLDPVLSQLGSFAKASSLKVQETLAISIVHCFELTRATDLELVDQGRVELDKSLGHRICTILLRQMCRRCAYLLGVIKTEMSFFSRRIGLSIYASLDRYLPSLSQFMLIDLKFDSYGSTLFADLLGISLEIFLTSTARSTLPLLVLNSNTTTIEAIAKAKEETVPGLLVYQAADILTELCSRNTTKELKKGAEIFYRLLNSGRENSSDPNQISIQIGKLMEMSAGLIYYRLIVKVGSEADRSRGPERVKAALRKALILKKSLADSSEISSDKEIQEELRENILPILSYMNGSLQDLRGKITMAEKIKVMHGLGNLIYLVDSGVSSYTPQIMTSLQASLAIPVLRSATLQTWDIFVKVTPLNDLMPFIGQITAAVVGVWPQMTADQIEVSISMLQHILRQRDRLGHYAFDIADLSGLSTSAIPSHDFPRVHPALVGIVQEQAGLKNNLTWTEKLKNLIGRINSESEIVIRQSLKELTTLLENDPEKMKMLMAGDTFHHLVGDVVKALIGVTSRCSDASDDIKSMAFECLGTVGAVDPDRCEISDEKSEMFLVSNFSDHDESVNFALHLLQTELIGGYRSTHDSRFHTFLTYAIQELLRFCGFTHDLVDPKKSANVPSSIKKKWHSMPKHILDSISPLLSSKFRFSFTNNISNNVPTYSHTTLYNSWLQNWLLRLITLVKNKDATDIFLPFLGTIRNGDSVISQKLLPHIALHIVISGSQEELENMKLEIVTVLEDQVERRSGFSPEGRQLVAQTIFGLMDHFSRWIRDRQKAQSAVNEHGGAKRRDHKTDADTMRVKSIMSQISPELIASAALYCKDHARALLNIEQQIVKLEGGQVASGQSMIVDDAPDEISPEEQLQKYYEKAHEIYAAVDEPDGMEGISAKITAPSIPHQIREHESTGRWTSAQSCWEVQLQRHPDELRSHLGLLRCLRNLGHYDSLRAHIVGVLQSHPDWERDLAPFSVESSLVSNNWEGLTRAVQVGSLESPEVIFGKVVDMLLNSDEQSFNEAMKDARIRLGNQILGASRKDAYKRMYDSAIYLHVLHELPLIDQACRDSSPAAGLSKIGLKAGLTTDRNLMNHLDFRLESISPAFRYREQLLRLRRATFQLRSRGAPAVGQLWVQTAKIARKAGHLQTAYSAVLQASELKAPTAFIQQAKLMKMEDQLYKAVLKLDDNLKNSPGKLIDGSFDRLNQLCPRDYAKASLQRVRWMDEVDRYSANHIIEHFNKVCAENPNWASSHYYFGRFYDDKASQVAPSIRTSTNQSRSTVAEWTYHCCKHFQKSLMFGTKFIYQALPRLLTLYFSFGEHPNLLAIFTKVESKGRKDGVEIHQEDYTAALRGDDLGGIFLRVDKVIQNAVKRLPVFEWLTVLPQVVSRVMHKSTHVQAIVHKILTHVLRSYPDQALWAMVSGVESSNSARSSRCTWVLQDATDVANSANPQLEPQNLASKIAQCRKIVKQLLRLCNFPIKNNAKHLSLHDVFPALQQCTPCDLLIPVQHSLIASLPPNDVNFANHQPFPSDLPCISSFIDKITIMSSMQKPRKIGIIGSDGKVYPFLCKPKDDLRKDARLMEFNSMINKLLKKDSESRRRNLHIRTYAVVVLNEECGLLEWVSNTIPFRHLLTGLYAPKGIQLWSNELKLLSEKIRKYRDEWDKVKDIFEKEILPKFPSVFHQWFLNNFPDPTSWLKSRQAYGRTCAVMSMVGFVLGLGDRHGENILFDSTNGDVVHVDFNCLFDKGRTFEVSENVPFRLTHNLVSGLGITGVEGVFRRASEVTMGILRNNKDSLMSVLETFVHDPLVDWMPSVSKRKGADAPTEEYVAREAKKALEPISRKLTGFQITSSVSGKCDRQMSTENQVDSLINEARDNRHLGRMYFGWGPYL